MSSLFNYLSQSLGKKTLKDFHLRKKLSLHCSVVSLWVEHRVYPVRKNNLCLNQINKSLIEIVQLCFPLKDQWT